MRLASDVPQVNLDKKSRRGRIPVHPDPSYRLCLAGPRDGAKALSYRLHALVASAASISTLRGGPLHRGFLCGLRLSPNHLFAGMFIVMKTPSFDQGSAGSMRTRAQIYSFMACLSIVVILVSKFIFDGRRTQGRHLDYNIVWLAANYFQFGAMRRALVGSVVYMSGVDLVTSAYLLYGMSVIFVLIFGYIFIKRIMEAGGRPLPFALILGALLLYWSEDIGRTDILVAAILLAAALAILSGRIVLASFCLAIGFQVHEVTAIYGLPLVAALLLQGDRYKNYRSAAGAIALP